MLLPIAAEFTVSTTFMVIAILAIAAQSVLLLVALFGKGPKYKVSVSDLHELSAEDFLRTLEAVTDARMTMNNEVDVCANGENFYIAELEAIRQAQCTINLEAYIFNMGVVAERFIHALAERARAGVTVNVVVDGVGSASTTEDDLRELIEAGGRVFWYHPLRFHTLPNYNNRTHRELLILDGQLAFIGGAGIADHWMISTDERKRWRDTMVSVRGLAVGNLQATFAENWLEACGEILAGPSYFPECEAGGNTRALVVNSTPSAGGSTRSRILMQTLLAYASRSIYITTPYFLPDKNLIAEVKRAMNRGVEVKILTPGEHNDHLLTRSSSRRAYGDLLKSGARIFEYDPGMLHAKILIIDGQWAIVGSANFDNRSFGLNDEVNVAVCDKEVAARLDGDFRNDIAESTEVSYEEWKNRSLLERAPEMLGWILERQQ
jgi:cardiolipin synthase A/B